MEVIVNWGAIAVGTVASMVLGMIWYSPKVFGNTWMKATGLTKKQMESDQMKGMFVAIFRSFILSFALFHIIYVTNAFYTDDSFLQNAIGTGLWIGIAIVGLTVFMHDVFESRSKIITKVNVGYEIVTVLAVALAIGVVGI